MADPDKDKPTEIELEFEQRERLIDMFQLVRTFDEREAVIRFCESMVPGRNVD